MTLQSSIPSMVTLGDSWGRHWCPDDPTVHRHRHLKFRGRRDVTSSSPWWWMSLVMEMALKWMICPTPSSFAKNHKVFMMVYDPKRVYDWKIAWWFKIVDAGWFKGYTPWSISFPRWFSNKKIQFGWHFGKNSSWGATPSSSANAGLIFLSFGVQFCCVAMN